MNWGIEDCGIDSEILAFIWDFRFLDLAGFFGVLAYLRFLAVTYEELNIAVSSFASTIAGSAYALSSF